MIKCPECGKEINEIVKECPNCGYPFEEGVKEVYEEVKEESKKEGASDEDKSEDIIFQTNEEINDRFVDDKEGKKRSINTKLLITCGVILLVVVIFVATKDLRTYYKAKNLLDNKNYTEAKSILYELDGYKDSNTLINECDYNIAQDYIKNESYEAAIERLENLAKDNYKDSGEQLNLCVYEIAKLALDNGEYEQALNSFYDLSQKGYKDSDNLYRQTSYELGKKYMENQEFEKAIKCLKHIDYKDSAELVDSIENGEKSLNKFIQRYNSMVQVLQEKQNIFLTPISAENVSDNVLKTGAGAEVTFNRNEDVDFNYDIASFMWYKKAWVFSDPEILLADWYCCVAGYLPNSDYDMVADIIGEMIESAGGDGIYGSTYYSDYFFTISKTKAELTISGQYQ